MASGSCDATIKIWHLNDHGKWMCAQTIDKNSQGHADVVNSVAFSPDGMTMASGSTTRIIKIWRLDNQGQWILAQILDQNNGGHKHSVNSVAFSPDGMTIASGSSDKTIKIWSNSDSIRYCYPKSAYKV